MDRTITTKNTKLILYFPNTWHIYFLIFSAMLLKRGSPSTLQREIEVILIIWKQLQLKSAQITLKRCQKMTFSHCFDLIFSFTKCL